MELSVDKRTLFGYTAGMIQKVIHKAKLQEHNEIRQNLEYWLSRSPQERVAAVEFYRRQVYGDIPRLQRVVQVVKRQPDTEAD